VGLCSSLRSPAAGGRIKKTLSLHQGQILSFLWALLIIPQAGLNKHMRWMQTFLVLTLNAKTFTYQTLEHRLHVSQQLCGSDGNIFVEKIRKAEAILNCISMLICPDLFNKGVKAINTLKQGEHHYEWFDNANLWPTFFSGIEVISNRITLPHRDKNTPFSAYDFLVSTGRYKQAFITLHDVSAELSYAPGTVVAISGRVLHHSVLDWDETVSPKGERLCIAHFIRDTVHDRLGVEWPDWVTNRPYLQMINKQFRTRQGWL
jgi:hypothetical protein